MTTRSRLNTMSEQQFVTTIGHVFEHSPWIAQRTFAKRPFDSITSLHERLVDTVRMSSDDEKLDLIRAHPDLVGTMARKADVTRESTAEQRAAGLTALSADEVRQFDEYNAAYRERFGFPFVICARQNKKEAILAEFPLRLRNARAQEIDTAIGDIYKIAWLRLIDTVSE